MSLKTWTAGVIFTIVAANGATAQSPSGSGQGTVPIDRAFLTGYWTDNGNCKGSLELMHDGRFRSGTGQGAWSLQGDMLTFTDKSTYTVRVTAPDRNTIIVSHPNGGEGRSTRCVLVPAQ